MDKQLMMDLVNEEYEDVKDVVELSAQPGEDVIARVDFNGGSHTYISFYYEQDYDVYEISDCGPSWS